MATLVSPGVDISITDESFFIPASAPTVPLFFIATRRDKMQPNGVTPAAGTREHSIVRTVTSIGQSTQLYGIPYFWRDAGGNEFHGDARNEYGLFALNQFLGVGNRAFVVRANIDTSDAPETFFAIDTPISTIPIAVGVGNGTISLPTAVSEFVKPEEFFVIFTSPTSYTVQGSESGIIGVGTANIPFVSTKVNFTITSGSIAFSQGDYFNFRLNYVPSSFVGVGNGQMTNLQPGDLAIDETWTISFISATTFTVTGSVSGPMLDGSVGVAYDNGYVKFTIVASSTAFAASDTFTIDIQEINLFNPLGANDAAKRLAIVTALQAEINSNTDVRSDIYEYNLIVCPGYHEVVDEMLSLSIDIADEAFVIADTPVNKTPEQIAVWALTAERATSSSVAYYYPWGQASNLDGRVITCAPSGIALRTYTYSDNDSYVWFAPAGIRRGTVTAINRIGYVTGTLGTATTFIEANLNQGQRDNLYEHFKNINPITFFPGRGIIVWGQKTSLNAASAMDRVNVVRLVMFIKRGLRKGSMPFVFEPNDKITRDNLKSMADGFLSGIMSQRGLYDFATLCDETNNTPDRIERNELYIDVGISPTRAAEFIYVPIRILSVGAAI